MAVRDSMTALIRRVRLLIDDGDSSCQTFTDQEIQDVLDACRMDMNNLQLIASPTFVGGTVQYLNFYSKLRDWEDDATFTKSLIQAITPTVSEPIVGHWKFGTSMYATVYLTGKTYDVYRAAADLLEVWSARKAFDYNIAVDGQKFQRDQVAPALLRLANTYRTKQRAQSISAIRSDLAGKGQRIDDLYIHYQT
jgi:hypothetical protein